VIKIAYIQSYPNQNYLIPQNITDLFPKNHVCYLIERIANNLDYSRFDKKYAGPGGPAYHPRILIKLMMMAYVDGIKSSRKIAKNASENVVYIYLAEKTQPDFHTISDFRTDNESLVNKTFKQVNSFAVEEGLIDLSHLMVDGTTIKADGNDNKSIDIETLDKLNNYVDKFVKESIKIDEEEDEKFGNRAMNQMPEDFTHKEKTRPIVTRIVKELNKAMIEDRKEDVQKIKEDVNKLKSEMQKKGLKKHNFTDPDARFMLNKKGKKEMSYNAQVTVDKNGLIISNDVVQDCDDRHQLLPNIDRVEEDFGQLPKGTKISADGLYLSPDITKLDDKGLDLYIPTYGAQKEKEKKKGFDKDDFKYDEEKDCYICPQDKVVEYFSTTKHHKYGFARNYKCRDCPNCPHQKACCNNNKYRQIIAPPHDKLLNRIKEKMKTDEGKSTYSLRKQTVEPAIGDIKRNKRFTEFLVRGLEKVKIEFNLVCIARNLVMINNMLKRKTTNNQGMTNKSKGILSFLANPC